MASRCAICKKFMTAKEGLTCTASECKKHYHRDCVGMSTKLHLTRPWTCPTCLKKKVTTKHSVTNSTNNLTTMAQKSNIIVPSSSKSEDYSGNSPIATMTTMAQKSNSTAEPSCSISDDYLGYSPSSRRQSISSETDVTNDSEPLQDPLDVSTSSLPELSGVVIEERVQLLEEKLTELTTELHSAHNEIETLVMENKKLKYLMRIY